MEAIRSLLAHLLDDQRAGVQAGAGVTVKPHLGPPLELGASTTTSLRGAWMNNLLRNYT